ncbi:MAG: DUF1015 family protein [Saprospiraceae bacterium]
MIIDSFSPIVPNTALVASADAFFSVVKHDYLNYRKRGMFLEHPGKCMLVYRLRENDSTYLGLIAGLPGEQYTDGKIKKHEGTLAASEQQQLQLLVLRDAVVKPVLLTYPAVSKVDAALEKLVSTQDPFLSIQDGSSISHELFEVKEGSQDEEFFKSAFAKTVDSLYIADGHHRCATLALYNRQQKEKGEATVPLLAALFSSKQVNVQAFHRSVHLPVELSPLALLARLSDLCTVDPLSEPELPKEKHQMTLLIGDESFSLRWREEVFAKLESNENAKNGIALDAGLFNQLIAAPIFGITDVRTDERITYVPGNKGLRGMLDRVQRRTDRVGFMLHGIEAEDLFQIVDAGLIMPPKSTWFEPRLRNGLVVLEV